MCLWCGEVWVFDRPCGPQDRPSHSRLMTCDQIMCACKFIMWDTTHPLDSDVMIGVCRLRSLTHPLVFYCSAGYCDQGLQCTSGREATGVQKRNEEVCSLSLLPPSPSPPSSSPSLLSPLSPSLISSSSFLYTRTQIHPDQLPVLQHR